MDLNYIKKLVKLVAESGVDEIEIEEEGKRVRIAKRQPVAPAPVASPQPSTFDVAVPSAPSPVPSVVPSAPPTPPVDSQQYHEIKSPIVGTFYRAPAPDASPFVQVGSEIQAGSVLCIVEAMKLMNEIESDVQGRIAKILAENGQPVEYDQTLFLVEPVRS